MNAAHDLSGANAGSADTATLTTLSLLAVTVTFHPDLEVLRQQVEHLLCAASEMSGKETNPFCEPKKRGFPFLSILLVDNGSKPETLAELHQWVDQDCRVKLMELGENRGLAAAHNCGIAVASEQGHTHVLLMDQDSLPAPNMVAELVQSFAKLTSERLRVAAVGPWYHDPVLDNPPDFLRLHWWGISRYSEQSNYPIVEVDYLISSGCLISLAALESVGTMQEALFIDYVDIEWGLRARRLGWTLHGVFAARMTHSLGPRIVRFLWRRFPLHSPQRHYFVVRNALWLYRDGALPLVWRVPHALRLLLRFSVYLLVGDSRRERLKFVWMGLRDGLLGRMGKPAWL